MRRVGVWALPSGVVVVVVGLSMLHSELAVPSYDYVGSFRFGWSLAYMGLLAVAAYGLGLPDVVRRRRQIVAAAVGAPALAAAGISLAQLALGSPLLPRMVVFGSGLLLVPWYMACAVFVGLARHVEEDRDRVVVIGEGGDAAALAAEFDRSAERPAIIRAVLAPSAARSTPDGRSPICETAEEVGATVVVLDRAAQFDQTIVDQVARLHEKGVRVRTLSLFYDEWLGKLPIGELERISLMFDIGEIHRLRYGRMKRVLDLGVATALLPLLLMVLPLVAMGDLVANRGPVLFRQRRVGKGGREFNMWKFRTMRPDDFTGSDMAAEWTSDDDPRVTPFGAALRRVHLDELPQLINIIRGDLSLVGPRPEQPEYVAELTAKLPFYEMRHLVRPGLTGWAQVKFGYASSESDALEKLQYEFWYMRHQSLAVDVRIIARTTRSVVSGDGR